MASLLLFSDEDRLWKSVSFYVFFFINEKKMEVEALFG